ncbi:MAG: hypothetical protein HY329_00555 [Chloroflexi bacterium]|nr:hypothetical protein [Chloroflexota bacterium]
MSARERLLGEDLEETLAPVDQAGLVVEQSRLDRLERLPHEGADLLSDPASQARVAGKADVGGAGGVRRCGGGRRPSDLAPLIR